MSYHYFQLMHGRAQSLSSPPVHAKLLLDYVPTLLPPQISDLHRGFKAWHEANLSTGDLLVQRLWLTVDHQLVLRFTLEEHPPPATPTSTCRELAHWLLLLDKWMETFVVLARARTFWSPAELIAALPFLAPAYLPAPLLALPPDNWQRLSHALAQAGADGTLAGEPTNRHWTEK